MMPCIEIFCITVLGLIVPDFAINDSPVWSAGEARYGKSKSVLSETVFVVPHCCYLQASSSRGKDCPYLTVSCRFDVVLTVHRR